MTSQLTDGLASKLRLAKQQKHITLWLLGVLSIVSTRLVVQQHDTRQHRLGLFCFFLLFPLFPAFSCAHLVGLFRVNMTESSLGLATSLMKPLALLVAGSTAAIA